MKLQAMGHMFPNSNREDSDRALQEKNHHLNEAMDVFLFSRPVFKVSKSCNKRIIKIEPLFKNTDKPEPEPEFLEIATNCSIGTFLSTTKVSVAGDRAFCLAAANGMSVFHNKTCLKLRSSYVSSNKVR